MGLIEIGWRIRIKWACLSAGISETTPPTWSPTCRSSAAGSSYQIGGTHAGTPQKSSDAHATDRSDYIKIGIPQFLGKAAAIVMKRILATHKHPRLGILLQNVVRSEDGTHQIILIRFGTLVFEVWSQTDFEESVRQDHIVQSC